MIAPVTDEPGPAYPGGANAKAYAFVFQVWVVLFLVIICFGLLNFVVSRFR
jgi:hypothetical protein